MQLNSKNKSIKIKVMFLYSFGKGCYRILFDTVHRCCCDRFSKEADWSIDGQEKVRRRPKQKMLGRERVEIEE